jgi:hypothetical protein
MNQQGGTDFHSLSPQGTSGKRVGERGFLKRHLLSPALSSTWGGGEGEVARSSIQGFNARLLRRILSLSLSPLGRGEEMNFGSARCTLRPI